MENTVSFRSSVNGFNRHEVMEYIQGLLTQNKEALEEANRLKRELADAQRELKEAKEALAASMTRCDSCEIKRDNEVKIGSALLDAKRFSELLILEARDKADEMYGYSQRDAQTISAKLSELKNSLLETSLETEQAFESMLERINGFSERLSCFCTETDHTRESFADIYGRYAAQTKSKGQDAGDPFFETKPPVTKNSGDESTESNGEPLPGEEESFVPDFGFLVDEVTEDPPKKTGKGGRKNECV